MRLASPGAGRNDHIHGDEGWRDLPDGMEQCSFCKKLVAKRKLEDYGRDRLCAACVERKGLLRCCDCGDLEHPADALIVRDQVFCNACSLMHECSGCEATSVEKFPLVGEYRVPLCGTCAAKETRAA